MIVCITYHILCTFSGPQHESCLVEALPMCHMPSSFLKWTRRARSLHLATAATGCNAATSNTDTHNDSNTNSSDNDNNYSKYNNEHNSNNNDGR